MKHHTKNGVPMSAPSSALLDMAVSMGFETKPLVYGVRIKGTDVVMSDTPWKGAYLCKTTDYTESDRATFGQAKLMPADKQCWRVCVESLATDPEEAKAQAMDMLALMAKKGHLENVAKAQGIDLDAEAPAEVAAEPIEEVAAEPAAEEPKATESPKERVGRRKKGKAKNKAKEAAPTDELDADLAAL